MKKKAGQKKAVKRQYLFLSAILFLIGVILARTGSGMFYNLDTFPLSGSQLTLDVPPDIVGAILWAYFKKYVIHYLRDYFLPVFIFVASSIIYASFAFSSLNVNIPEKQKTGTSVLVFLFLLTLVGITIIHFSVMKGFPFISDEFSYLFGSDLLSEGKLFTASPPMHDFYHVMNLVNNGRWYSKYTIGFPLLLAAGKILHVRFLVNPLCSAFLIVFLFLTVRRLSDLIPAISACILAIFSPFFLVLGAVYFPHAANAMCSVAAVYFFLKTTDEKGWLNPALAGVFAGFNLLIRPPDGAIILIGILPFIIYGLMKSGDKKGAAFRFVFSFLFIFLCVAVMLAVNQIQNGSLLLFGFNVYYPEEKWGFGSFEHNFIKGLWNIAYAHMRNALWTVPFMLIFSILSFAAKDKQPALLVIPFILLTIFYIGWHGLGGKDYGSRFYLPVFMLLLIPAVSGIIEVGRRLEKKTTAKPELFIVVFTIITAAYSFTAILLPLLSSLLELNKAQLEQWQFIENPPGLTSPALIFIQGTDGAMNFMFTRNSHDYINQKNIYVLYLDPEENEKLIRLFPDRTPYILYINPKGGGFILRAADNRKNVINYYLAALNYMEGVWDNDKAELEYLKALELDPENAEISLSLANLYIKKKKDYAKALPILRKLATVPGYRNAYYFIGRCLYDSGKKEEAIKTLEEFASGSPKDEITARALQWAQYYKKVK